MLMIDLYMHSAAEMLYVVTMSIVLLQLDALTIFRCFYSLQSDKRGVTMLHPRIRPGLLTIALTTYQCAIIIEASEV
jgi:hypothetical protein